VCVIRHKEYPTSPAAQALIRAIHDYLRGAPLPAGCKRVPASRKALTEMPLTEMPLT